MMAENMTQNMASNSNLLSPPRSSSQHKEKRNPSITPRRFGRFFTPRTRPSSQPSAAGRALRDLTGSALNATRGRTPSSPLKAPSEFDGGDGALLPARPGKRRKIRHTPESSPIQSVPNLMITPAASETESFSRPALLSPIQSIRSNQDLCDSDDDIFSNASLPSSPISRSRPTPLSRRGMASQLVQRQIGDMPGAGRQFMSYPSCDWRVETADFHSQPEDVHFCSAHEPGAQRCIPFCVASCNTNSLVAVGDEEGRVRLLDSDRSGSADFRQYHLSFQVHGNAVIDLEFSKDDQLLATAAGDQTGRVIDMMTQTPVSILGHHTASLKQVRFQPGRGMGHVLATSSRDGSVQIWDLRCKGGPIQEVAVEREQFRFGVDRKINAGCVVNSIYDAHARPMRLSRNQMHQGLTASDVASRPDNEISVTAIQFLPEGREHLLLSASQADSVVKLWDIRSIHSSRQHKSSVPVSFTAPPESHSAWRPFGISSMCLSSDAARLYTACKDNTVYAYSIAHLVLGHAPELSSRAANDPPRRNRTGGAHEGLGPLYGLRHDKFHATSFYVKSAIRSARDGRSELLAVGSSDGCAVLFPTDERHFRADMPGFSATHAPAAVADSVRRPLFQRKPSGTSNNPAARLVDTIPIHRTGTALVRGHEKEVGALAWTRDGKLVTTGDDYLVRCWGEERRGDAKDAAGLRTGGEAEGRRWGCGWADVGDGWDDRDDEDEF